MAERKLRERVALTHPSGRFTVVVGPARAERLLSRGYRRFTESVVTAAGETTDVPKRAELAERARKLDVPVKGTNAELFAAITAAEVQAEQEA